jgi:hypothetical protein
MNQYASTKLSQQCDVSFRNSELLQDDKITIKKVRKELQIIFRTITNISPCASDFHNYNNLCKIFDDIISSKQYKLNEAITIVLNYLRYFVEKHFDQNRYSNPIRKVDSRIYFNIIKYINKFENKIWQYECNRIFAKKYAKNSSKKRNEGEVISVDTWLEHAQDRYEQHEIVILADNIQICSDGKPKKQLPNLSAFYSHVKENNCDTHMEGQFTPMLQCYPRCPLMMTENLDVANNQVNGTQGFYAGAVLKVDNEFHIRHIDGVVVQCAYASQLEYILWEVNGMIVNIKPKQYTSVRANVSLLREMQIVCDKSTAVHINAIQIPLIPSNLIMNHKLQGLSIC